MLIARAGLLLFVLTSLGCTVQVIAPPAAAAKQSELSASDRIVTPVNFKCLPSGTVQNFDDGTTITWLGYDPSHSDLCIGRNKNGAAIQRIRGLWSTNSLWPDSLPGVRNALATLTTKSPGTVATFQTTGTTSNRNDPRPGTWKHSMSISKRETLVVPAGKFETYVIDEDYSSPSGIGQWKRLWWVDLKTGALLKTETVASTNGAYPKYETTLLQLPR